IEAWGAAQEVPGAQVGVLLPGELSWTGAFGVDPVAGTALAPGTRFDATSTTKSFTAALIFQLADQGLIDLEAGLPPLDAVPGFVDHAAMTPRQLLGHRSGLMNYRDTPEYLANPGSVGSAQEAVAASVRAPRSGVPGEEAEYSSTNYLVLGLLAEQVSGRSFDDLLTERLLRPLRLNRTTHTPPGPAAPNSGTSGIVTDVPDLLRWGAAFYRDGAVMSDAASAVMHDMDGSSSLGPGSVGMCPCAKTADGRPWWEWIGYTGSTNTVQYSARRDMVFTLRVTDDLWQPGRIESVVALAGHLDDMAVAAR
ncbi:MAG: serine hydrolase domain-containing protein, partial [Acidimicrobiales bacterium]